MTKQELLAKWKARDLSWSQISSFEYSKEQWYRSYWLGQKDPPSPEMLFGSKVGKQLETDPTFLPMIPRRSTMEYKFEAEFDGIKLVGYADSFGECIDGKYVYALEEYKTGVKAWDKKRVDQHGQITMYLFMYYLKTKAKPEDILCSLHWMPTKKTENGDFSVEIDFVEDIENKIQHFETKRTMRDIMEFGIRIKKTVREMEEYGLLHE
jgi:hypothetical protein